MLTSEIPSTGPDRIVPGTPDCHVVTVCTDHPFNATLANRPERFWKNGTFHTPVIETRCGTSKFETARSRFSALAFCGKPLSLASCVGLSDDELSIDFDHVY